MTIDTPQFISNNSSLPSLSSILTNPHEVLPRLIHSQFSGLPRANHDSAMLAEALNDGFIAVDTVVLPWRPMLVESLIEEILADEPSCHESHEHRELKVLGRILALASAPDSMLEPEAPATSGRYPLRADLIVWHATGVSESYECGATDGRSVLEQLMDGQVRVTILPYAGLGMPFIHAYSFRMGENPPHKAPTAVDGMRAWEQILAARPTTLPAIHTLLA